MQLRAVPKGTPVSAARAKLADNIAEIAAHTAELAAADRALERAEQLKRRARVAAEEAEAALGKAKVAAGAHLIEQAHGREAPTPMTIREARNDLQNARDELAAAEQAVEAVKEQRDQLGQHISGSWRLTRSIADVLRTAPEVAALLDEVERLQNALAPAAIALLKLVSAGGIDLEQVDNPERPGWKTDTRAGVIVRRLNTPLNAWPGTVEHAPAVAAWVAALEGLKTDAGTLLPK